MNRKYVIKSGTDFRNMSKITIKKASGDGFDIDVEKVDLDSSIPEDKAVKESVTKRLSKWHLIGLTLGRIHKAT